MSLYFRDHINRLVRADPFRNLSLGHLTPSPTQSSPADLPKFPLGDIEPIPMDQHERNPLGHILGGAHNRQYRVNRRVEDHKSGNNAGEVTLHGKHPSQQ